MASINREDLLAAAMNQDEYLGFCKKCGFEQDGCEPDAENYKCEDCGAMAVTGAELLVLEGYAG